MDELKIALSLLPSVVKYVGPYDIWNMLNTSCKQYDIWRVAIVVVNWYGPITSQLYFDPDDLIRKSPTHKMWQYFYEICQFGKYRYAKAALSHIILGRPDQNQIWSMTTLNKRVFLQIWFYGDDRIWELICPRIPRKFVDSIAQYIPMYTLRHLRVVVEHHDTWKYDDRMSYHIRMTLKDNMTDLFAYVIKDVDNILDGISIMETYGEGGCRYRMSTRDVYWLADNPTDIIDKCIYRLLPYIPRGPEYTEVNVPHDIKTKLPRNMHYAVKIFRMQGYQYQGWIDYYESLASV